jgi:hypothetical protein
MGRARAAESLQRPQACAAGTPERAMKYLVHWTFDPAAYPAIVSRFLESGGAPPRTVQLIGRWHGLSGDGFAVVETDDDKALYVWRAQWSDLLRMSVAPCLDDTETAMVLSSMRR